MARVTYVKAAKGRKDGRPRRCSRCGNEIKPGESYSWFANRIGRSSIRKDFCSNCRIRESDKTTSPHMQTIYAGQEAAEDTLGQADLTLADIAEAVRGYAEALKEASESYGESADNMEDGFGHETEMSAAIREKAESCESTADTVESAADDIESMDDPDADAAEFQDDYEGDWDDEKDEAVDTEEWEQHVEAKREERREAAIDAANEALGEWPDL